MRLRSRNCHCTGGDGLQTCSVPDASAELTSQTRVLDWCGIRYRFERMQPAVQPRHSEIEWAVSRQGEFPGTMRIPPGESTRDCELGAWHWLRELPSLDAGAHVAALSW